MVFYGGFGAYFAKRGVSSDDTQSAIKEIRAHRDPVRADAGATAHALQGLLGQKLTAVIAGVRGAHAVGEWARGTHKPHPKAEERLRNAYQVAKLLEREESRETIRAWFVGMNPELDDHPPALVIAEEPVRVLQAARSFLAHG